MVSMMKEYIESIKKCLANENYHAALFLSLSIPDICGSLETPEVKNGIRAKRWFSQNLREKYLPDNCYEHLMATDPIAADAMIEEQKEFLRNQPFKKNFTEDTYWNLRNAMTHSASDFAKNKKIYLTFGESHLVALKDGIQISVRVFCNDICEATLKWLDRVNDDMEIMDRINLRAEISNSLFGGLVQIH